MMTVTGLVVYHVLAKKGVATVDEIEDIVIRRIPVLAGVFANSSPYEVEEEIEATIQEINMYAKNELEIELCVEKAGKTIMVHKYCIGLVKRLYEQLKHQIETTDSLLADYGRLILPVLE